jgi:hypothetical protein
MRAGARSAGWGHSTRQAATDRLGFSGVLYGLVGVGLAWFLGWILARSMLETHGLWWVRLIHFVQDVSLFLFMAIGAITRDAAERPAVSSMEPSSRFGRWPGRRTLRRPPAG